MMTRGRATRSHDERGAALIVALAAVALLVALGGALLLATMGDTRIAANYRESSEALHAAEAAIERAIPDLMAEPDWNRVLGGAVQSSFVDGPASGMRVLADGSVLDLVEATNLVRCARAAGCSDAEVDASADDRIWGPNNPRWQLYAYGLLNRLLPPGMIDSRTYVVVWVADDPAENDGRPLEDGTDAGNPGHGVVALLAHAHGLYGARRSVEVTLARRGGALQVLSWREVR